MANGAPFQPTFPPWPHLDHGSGPRVRRADVAATGTVAGTEVDDASGGTTTAGGTTAPGRARSA